MSTFASRRGNDSCLTVILLSGVAVLLTAGLVMLFKADAASDQDAVDGREQAIAALVERYDVESIEVHYEVTDDDNLVQIDRAGNLDDSAIRAQVEAVVTIDGMRRPDCRIADEKTDPRLDCADGEPAEREQKSKP